MKVRITIIVDVDYTPEEALEKFDASDVYTLAANMQRLAHQRIQELVEDDAEGITVMVEPLGGANG